jgi:hypothetical protein
MKGCIRLGLTVTLACLALLFGCASLSFLQPGANLFIIRGKPAAKCELADHAMVRLYISHGSSATTSDACSVRFQEAGWPFERRIFYAYSSPWVENIVCKGDKVELIMHGEGLTLSADRIRNVLVYQPLEYGKGVPNSSNTPINLMVGIVLLGLCLIAVGTLLRLNRLRIFRRKGSTAINRRAASEAR